MTATYWEIGRRILQSSEGGKDRAANGDALLVRLSADLTKQFGRGFGVDNLELMRLIYRTYSAAEISESLIRKSGDGGRSDKSETRVCSVISNWTGRCVFCCMTVARGATR